MSNWAYYDISTDTIHGCQEGTISYFHEQGHQEWARKGREQALQQLSWVFILVFLPFAVALTHNLILTIASSIPLFAFLLSEIHAWIYALIKFYRWSKEHVKDK